MAYFTDAQSRLILIPFLSSYTRHGAPLERGDLDLSYSTDMAILWIEKQVLLVEGIIPTGIMARSKMTVHWQMA